MVCTKETLWWPWPHWFGVGIIWYWHPQFLVLNLYHLYDDSTILSPDDWFPDWLSQYSLFQANPRLFCHHDNCPSVVMTTVSRWWLSLSLQIVGLQSADGRDVIAASGHRGITVHPLRTHCPQKCTCHPTQQCTHDKWFQTVQCTPTLGPLLSPILGKPQFEWTES